MMRCCLVSFQLSTSLKEPVLSFCFIDLTLASVGEQQGTAIWSLVAIIITIIITVIFNDTNLFVSFFFSLFAVRNLKTTAIVKFHAARYGYFIFNSNKI